MTTFEKQTVLITGGTSGIGKATALAFAKAGANVVVAGLQVAEGEQVAREITSSGGGALARRRRWNSPDRVSASIASLPARSRPKCSIGLSAKGRPI
jgi:NAD(P)-dependent dehydrogenase (short-subunit alcohol dehydrogenase family)